MKRISRWRTTALLLLATLVLALSACSGSGGADQVLPAMGKDEKATIKVTYWDEDGFFRDFGNLFLVQNPNIDIEVVSTNGIYGPDKDPIEEMKKLIETEQPDVLMVDAYFMEKFIEEGLLYELDPVIAQDKFDLEGILPAAITALRSYGNGKLYGLAPTFNSSAIFYNKTLFETHGVPLPSDGMTWEETLQLAERFPKDGSNEDRIYGLDVSRGGANDPWLLLRMGAERGLSFVDAAAGTITINTDSWKETVNLVLQLAKSEAIYKQQPDQMQQRQSYEDYLLSDSFIGGHTAMKIEGIYLMDQLDDAKTQLRDKFQLDWDVVTVPVHADNPTVSNSFGLNQIFSINAKSPNLRAAWEFVKYINSDTMARVTARAPVFGGLPVRTEYIRNEEGKHLEAFYSLEARPVDMFAVYNELPQSFFGTFNGIVSKHWEAVINETKTIDEMLASIETEGQAALDKALEEKAAQPGDTSEPQTEQTEAPAEAVTEVVTEE